MSIHEAVFQDGAILQGFGSSYMPQDSSLFTTAPAPTRGADVSEAYFKHMRSRQLVATEQLALQGCGAPRSCALWPSSAELDDCIWLFRSEFHKRR